jgi:hypothetical protein
MQSGCRTIIDGKPTNSLKFLTVAAPVRRGKKPHFGGGGWWSRPVQHCVHTQHFIIVVVARFAQLGCFHTT